MVKRFDITRQLAAALTLAGSGGVGGLLKSRKYAKNFKKGTTTTKSVMNRRSVKRRGGSRTLTKTTRRNRETPVPNAEYTRNTVSLGYKPRQNLRGAWKLLNQNKASTVYGYRLLSAFGGSNGVMPLINTSTTTSTGTYSVPCNLWDITSAINVVGGTVTAPNIFWRPQFSDPTATGTLQWQNTYNWSVENSDHAASIVDTYPNGSDTLDWFQSKMMFYCPTTLPCRYQIDVVQFKDTRVVPGETSTFAAAFWQGVMKRFIYSPLESGDHKYQKYFKTLYSNSFILNPKETSEVVNTIFREVNIFMRLNRRATYDWADQDRMNMPSSSDYQQNDGTNIQTTVHPRARIFLMVRAQAGWGTAYSNAIMPSYDIVLRTKHSQLAG